MPRHLFRKYLPSHESVRANPYISRFGSFLQHPMLWCLNRRSVAGGVAVGLFSGLVPGPLQMLTAALLAIPLKVNLPIALGTTLYTNPFTIGPLYFLAYEIGKLVISGGAPPNPAPEMDWSHMLSWMESFGYWLLSMGKPLALGLVILALGLAFLGYLAVHLAWRLHVMHAWERRTQRRARAEKSRP
jgi:uncharacterized protein (DUF2062 family)